MREGQRDRWDKALDDALASYGEAPEREGLERRVLARVTERTMRGRPIRRLALVMGTMAAAVCGLVWWETPREAVQTHAAYTAVPTVRKIEPQTVKTIAARDHVGVLASADKPSRTRRNLVEPKLSRFPRPTPLSSEERALLLLAARARRDIPLELTSLGSPIEPIQVPAIEIKPLE